MPAEYVEDAEVVMFARGPMTGVWQIERTRRGRPGPSPVSRVRGQGKGSNRVAMSLANGLARQLRFERDEDVELPGTVRDSLGGTVRMRRHVFTLVVDRRQHGPIDAAEAWDDTH